MMTDDDFNTWAADTDDWERLRTYLRTMHNTAVAAETVLIHMEGIKRRRADQTSHHAAGAQTWPHYWSTHCIHSHHDRCHLDCKVCGAHCLCPCHQQDPEAP